MILFCMFPPITGRGCAKTKVGTREEVGGEDSASSSTPVDGMLTSAFEPPLSSDEFELLAFADVSAVGPSGIYDCLSFPWFFLSLYVRINLGSLSIIEQLQNPSLRIP